MKNKPKYKCGDIVVFPAMKYEKRVSLPDPKEVFGENAAEAWRRYGSELEGVRRWTEETVGVIKIVDVGGALGVNEHSYDILDPFAPFLHKHVPESSVAGLVDDEGVINACREAYGLFEEKTRALRETHPPLRVSN